MNFYSNDGSFTKEPFPKFEASHSLGRNHFYSVFVAIHDGVEMEGSAGKTKPVDGKFKVVKSSRSGRYMIVPATPATEPKTVLAFIGDTAGFRGEVGMIKEDTSAEILQQGVTHAAATGNITVVALMREGDRVVTFSNGRRNDDRFVYTNKGGKIVRTAYTADEYAVVFDYE